MFIKTSFYFEYILPLFPNDSSNKSTGLLNDFQIINSYRLM